MIDNKKALKTYVPFSQIITVKTATNTTERVLNFIHANKNIHPQKTNKIVNLLLSIPITRHFEILMSWIAMSFYEIFK